MPKVFEITDADLMPKVTRGNLTATLIHCEDVGDEDAKAFFVTVEAQGKQANGSAYIRKDAIDRAMARLEQAISKPLSFNW